MAQEDPEELAAELEREREALQRQSTELHDQVKETRQDWERKRSDESVPGAPEPEGDEEIDGEEEESADSSPNEGGEASEDEGPEEGPETTGKG